MSAGLWVSFVLLAILSIICGIFLGKRIVLSRFSDGICIRADDGEVYLRLSEEAQIKLSDPSTEILILKVIDAHTRNKHSL
jgi:hypothetical protein